MLRLAPSRASVLASWGFSPCRVGGRLLGGTPWSSSGIQPVDRGLFCVQMRGASAFLGPFNVDSAQSVLLTVCVSVTNGLLVLSGSVPQIHQRPPGSCESRHRSCAHTRASSWPVGVRSGSNGPTGPGYSKIGRDPVLVFSGSLGEALCDAGTGVSWQVGSMPVTPWLVGSPGSWTEASFRPAGSMLFSWEGRCPYPCLDLSVVLQTGLLRAWSPPW